MVNSFQSGGNPHIAERRFCWRERLLFPRAELGDDNRGIVLNISQNGLALQADTELIDDDLPEIRFRFSPSLPWVEAKGRIAWRSASKKEAGIEFTGLSDEVRDQIETWISWSVPIGFLDTKVSFEQSNHFEERKPSSETGSTNPDHVPEVVDLIPEKQSKRSFFAFVRSPVQTQDARTILTNSADENIAGGFSNASRRVGLSVTAVLLLLAFFLPGYHLQKMERNQKDVEVIIAPKQFALSSEPSAIPTANPRPTSEFPSFALQVGAMVHEENAHALAESLRQMNFPVSVYRHPTDRFHLVVVGPYTSVDDASRAKNELEKSGFKAIRTEWTPQAQ